MGMMGPMMGAPMPYDSRRSERGDRDESGDYYDAQRGDGRGASRGHSHRRGGERDGRKDRRQPYYSSQNYNTQPGDGLSSQMSSMSLGSNLTQNLTQTSSSGPLTQASSTLSQPMSQPSLSALSQESYQGDDFYKSQSFVDPYM
jgi:hypothetical protein